MNDKWMAQANCKGMDWFVEDGNLHQKREICYGCPVKAECLAYALDNLDDSAIVYAGTTGNQRKALL